MVNLFLLGLSFFVSAQTSPVIDPDKFTICAITINSDDERKVFDAQAKKDPKHFNPVVELTTMGSKENWFKNACKSGIRCDQLVISGHFAGSFFGDNNEKELTLETLEEAGCSKTCENILSNPYEVFLLGCNTLAEKEKDHRTPAQYLQVLLQDGFSRREAERVVEARYGETGDSNKAGMQRAFSGEKKQIFGFSSTGPLGKTIKRFLENYFANHNPKEHLDKLQAKRMLDKVDLTNDLLAKNLKTFSFDQCEGGDLSQDESLRKVCDLLNTSLSIEKRLEVAQELFGKENYLSYIPAIKKFFHNNPPLSYSQEEKKEFEQIQANKVIREQILGLVEKSRGSSLTMMQEWSELAQLMGFMSSEERYKKINSTIVDMLKNDLPDDNDICSLERDSEIKVSLSELENVKFTKDVISALACLSGDQELSKHMESLLLSSQNAEIQVALMEYLKYKSFREEKFSDDLHNHLGVIIQKNKSRKSIFLAAELLGRSHSNEPLVVKTLLSFLNSKNFDEVEDAVYAFQSIGVRDEATMRSLVQFAKSQPDQRDSVVTSLLKSENKEALKKLKRELQGLKGLNSVLKEKIDKIE